MCPPVCVAFQAGAVAAAAAVPVKEAADVEKQIVNASPSADKEKPGDSKAKPEPKPQVSFQQYLVLHSSSVTILSEF